MRNLKSLTVNWMFGCSKNRARGTFRAMSDLVDWIVHRPIVPKTQMSIERDIGILADRFRSAFENQRFNSEVTAQILQNSRRIPRPVPFMWRESTSFQTFILMFSSISPHSDFCRFWSTSWIPALWSKRFPCSTSQFIGVLFPLEKQSLSSAL
jgi:hypothetical protein